MRSLFAVIVLLTVCSFARADFEMGDYLRVSRTYRALSDLNRLLDIASTLDRQNSKFDDYSDEADDYFLRESEVSDNLAKIIGTRIRKRVHQIDPAVKPFLEGWLKQLGDRPFEVTSADDKTWGQIARAQRKVFFGFRSALIPLLEGYRKEYRKQRVEFREILASTDSRSLHKEIWFQEVLRSLAANLEELDETESELRAQIKKLRSEMQSVETELAKYTEQRDAFEQRQQQIEAGIYAVLKLVRPYLKFGDVSFDILTTRLVDPEPELEPAKAQLEALFAENRSKFYADFPDAPDLNLHLDIEIVRAERLRSWGRAYTRFHFVVRVSLIGLAGEVTKPLAPFSMEIRSGLLLNRESLEAVLTRHIRAATSTTYERFKATDSAGSLLQLRQNLVERICNTAIAAGGLQPPPPPENLSPDLE